MNAEAAPAYIWRVLHLAAGEQISWVSRMLGHSTAKVTWDRYNRSIPNLTREDGGAFKDAMMNRTGASLNQSSDAT